MKSPKTFRLILEACEKLTRQTNGAGGIQFVHAAAPGLKAEFWAQFARPGSARESEWKATPMMRLPPLIARLSPAEQRRSRRRCSERRWW